MLKWVGCLLLLAGMGGYGGCMAEEYQIRLHTLQAVEELVTILAGYISYERDTLPEAILHCSEKIEGTGKEFLQYVKRKMDEKKGVSMEAAWKEGIFLWENILEEEELERFQNLFEHTGYLDRKMQVHMLESYRNELKEKIEKRMQEKEKKCRIYYSVGLLGGLFFCILLW